MKTFSQWLEVQDVDKELQRFQMDVAAAASQEGNPNSSSADQVKKIADKYKSKFTQQVRDPNNPQGPAAAAAVGVTSRTVAATNGSALPAKNKTGGQPQ